MQAQFTYHIRTPQNNGFKSNCTKSYKIASNENVKIALFGDEKFVKHRENAPYKQAGFLRLLSNTFPSRIQGTCSTISMYYKCVVGSSTNS